MKDSIQVYEERKEFKSLAVDCSFFLFFFLLMCVLCVGCVVYF